MILQNNKQKAFTIVELLIVIVVIGILAAISIVAYNGIQNRARDTAVKDSASQVRSKIETWSSIKGSYPSSADWGTGEGAKLVDTNATEAEVPADVASMVKTSGAPDAHGSGQQIALTLCEDGADIEYYQSGTNGEITVGEGCS